MSSFNVWVFAIRRRPGHAAFEVRWRVAGRDKSRSFMTRALADSYRAELVHAARQGQAFGTATGEPAAWVAPEPVTVTWYQHAMAYAEMKWPHLAPHSRASLAGALATVTPLLTRETGRRPPAGRVRAALYGYAFNPPRRSRAPDHPVTVSARAWLERASLPVGQPSDPRVIRAALDRLCVRLDGSPAAANTTTRKRAVFHGALGYAVELGLLPANPIDLVHWHTPRAAAALNPATVASPAQVRAILAQAARIRPELAAFFSCPYYAALRPEEAVALRRDDLILPTHRRGKIILTAACPRTGTAWTSTGRPHESPGLSSTAPTAPSASSPSRLSWCVSFAVTSGSSAPHRMGGCSAAPVAACSANPSMAASGTLPARRRSDRSWPPLRLPVARTTCGTPPCRCGSTPADRRRPRRRHQQHLPVLPRPLAHRRWRSAQVP
ncbi:MAG TPA: hypothetical protein VMV92_15655 [Streptosporangiaceae bacterium]|nr:hypothetical protein [Streptosporangiaceae bacterium]